MVKKIIIISTLVSTLLQAEMKEKGFFIGIDGSIGSADVSYANSGAFASSDYESNSKISALALKFGYHYYFTKVYARINKRVKYTDNTKSYFELKNHVLELNVDYIPIFYMSKNKDWSLKGVFGVGCGFNKNSLINYNLWLDTSGNNQDPILDKKTQYSMEYGYNLGLIAELDFGLSVEAGYRYRSGILTQFSDKDAGNEATFDLSTKELYVGVNYLF